MSKMEMIGQRAYIKRKECHKMTQPKKEVQALYCRHCGLRTTNLKAVHCQKCGRTRFSTTPVTPFTATTPIVLLAIALLLVAAIAIILPGLIGWQWTTPIMVGLALIIIGTAFWVVFECVKNHPQWAKVCTIVLYSVGVFVVVAALAIFGSTIAANAIQTPAATATANVTATAEPTPTPTATETLAPTASPSPTSSPTVTPEPTTVVSLPTTPAIFASVNGKDYGNVGIFLDTNLGKRMTFTCRSILIPNKEWNDTLTKDELTKVEETWVDVKVDVPEGMTAVLFAGGLEQGTNRYENGVLMTLDPGHYEFKLRNGEIVNWYPSQDEYRVNDFKRIIDQVRHGNFDIKSKLDMFVSTADLFSQIPDDLVRKYNIQIVPDLDPSK